MEVLASPVNVAGDYTLTFIADNACADLPDKVRTRTYEATITPGAGTTIPAHLYLNGMVVGASFLERYAASRFTLPAAASQSPSWVICTATLVSWSRSIPTRIRIRRLGRRLGGPRRLHDLDVPSWLHRLLRHEVCKWANVIAAIRARRWHRHAARPQIIG